MRGAAGRSSAAWRWPGAVLALALSAVCAGGSPRPLLAASSRGQATPSDPAIRASFLFSFARFTEWPVQALAAGAPIRFCVGDHALASALEATVAGRSIRRHPLDVQLVAPDGATPACQVLDLSGLDVEQSSRVVDSLRGAAVLTVGDTPRFTTAGGVASARVEDGSVRLTINVVAASRARLRIAAALLNLAAIVGDAGRD